MNSLTINDSSTTNLGRLLGEAKQGNADSLGQLLQNYENYLKLLAHTQLDDKVRQRVSPSDVVQETMLEAHCDFHGFRGSSDGEFVAWLRKILVNNLARAVEKHVLAAKRDVRREVSKIQINASIDQSAMRIESILADNHPSVESDASLQEQLVQLGNALAELSPDHRDVIVMRHIESVSFATIAQRIDRSVGATRMLWLRAIEQLRKRMSSEDQS